MWSLMAALLLGGCSSPEPAATPAKAAKAKNAKGSKSGKKGRKAKAPSAAPPLGVAGPVTGELSLAVVTPTPPPAVAPADGAPADGAAPAPAPAPAPSGPPQTEAKLLLTFSDGSQTPLSLGKVTGTCAEKTPVPIGPEGMQQTPLWSVSCSDPAGATSELAITQVADQLTVFKAATIAGKVDYRPVKRIRLAPGATLSKKSG